ncbi:LysR family transcriptional regulator [Photobacterium damselae]|uniref:LysR family transcriptional regulator n=1 Tax=Photobacterium damselae TaxID=38293 RepID=UPI001EFD794B|nr:LysR family transcriptional regulator [Photobacterium damselae]MCG9778039.1 LysR family transcriptional regulator [Photobacterium damselae]
MNLIYLQTFLAVAEKKSFTLAAKELGVSKGLVSRHIKNLEDSCNAKLFYRTTRSIQLTEIGEELHIKAKEIQAIAVEAKTRVRDMTQELSGSLKVTAPFELGAMLCRHVIPSYKKSYPEISLELNFGPTAKKIEIGDFDIALRAYNELPNDVVAKELGFIRNVLVCSHNYARNNKHININNLEKYNFILNGQNSKWNELQLFSKINNINDIKQVEGNVSANTYHSLLELASQDLGIVSVPYYQVKELIDSNKIVHLLPEWSIKTHKLYLVYAQRRVIPKKMSLFNSAVTEWLSTDNQYLL